MFSRVFVDKQFQAIVHATSLDQRHNLLIKLIQKAYSLHFVIISLVSRFGKY